MHAAVWGGALVQQAECASSARDSFFAVRAYFVERSFKHFFELKHKCRRKLRIRAMQPRHDLHCGPHFDVLELEIADGGRDFTHVPAAGDA